MNNPPFFYRGGILIRCLVCGREIPKNTTIDDCVIIAGITEEGDHWQGFAFICKLACFLKLKERIFKDKQGNITVFPQN